MVYLRAIWKHHENATKLPWKLQPIFMTHEFGPLSLEIHDPRSWKWHHEFTMKNSLVFHCLYLGLVNPMNLIRGIYFHGSRKWTIFMGNSVENQRKFMVLFHGPMKVPWQYHENTMKKFMAFNFHSAPLLTFFELTFVNLKGRKTLVNFCFEVCTGRAVVLTILLQFCCAVFLNIISILWSGSKW